ncbi:MAG: hypothetical protein PHW65_03595 [Dehalococcoidales bacterium]|nr:hypothetical protein [Dehalococcoidales bacterium]
MTRKVNARSLYQCLKAKVQGKVIRCAAGHKFPCQADGVVPVDYLKSGRPLILITCQTCPDFEQIGERLSDAERGWKEK